jgi:hypothetical protein
MKLNRGVLSTTAFVVVATTVVLLEQQVFASQSIVPFGNSRKGLEVSSSLKQPYLKHSWATVPRGGFESAPVSTSTASPDSVGAMVVSAVKGLMSYMAGPKADTLLLLLTTALNTPICKMLGTSPILGFLAWGVLFGPNGFSLIKDVHTTESTLGLMCFLGFALDFDFMLI